MKLSKMFLKIYIVLIYCTFIKSVLWKKYTYVWKYNNVCLQGGDGVGRGL